MIYAVRFSKRMKAWVLYKGKTRLDKTWIYKRAAWKEARRLAIGSEGVAALYYKDGRVVSNSYEKRKEEDVD